jgi:hypothetical protein
MPYRRADNGALSTRRWAVEPLVVPSGEREMPVVIAGGLAGLLLYVFKRRGDTNTENEQLRHR